MATWSVVADIDTEFYKQSPDENRGTVDDMEALVMIVGGIKTVLMRALMNFTLSGFSGDVSDIVSAKLTLDVYQVQNEGQQVHFRRCTRPDTWRENEATWNDFRIGDAWTAGGGDSTETDKVTTTIPASAPGVTDILGFKTLVIDALENRDGIFSLLMRMNDESESGDTRQYNVRTRETTIGEPPKLVITYGAVVATNRRRLMVY